MKKGIIKRPSENFTPKTRYIVIWACIVLVFAIYLWTRDARVLGTLTTILPALK